MQCPFCQTLENKVIDSRLIGVGDQIRRRRECLACAGRFTTYEKIELSLPRLIKRDNSHVQFKEEKLRLGILRALEKRPVAIEVVDQIVEKVIYLLRSSADREISTNAIGELVMSELKQIDEVAYVRFASVYKKFKHVDQFNVEIEHLKANKR